jgi:predicted nucleic acid-binding protein
MIAVLDASVGIEIALNRPKAVIFDTIFQKAKKIIAPDLYKAEITNVLWKYQRAKMISREEAMKRLLFCENLVEEYIDLGTNSEEVLVEAIRLNHSAYDLFYLTLARRHGGVLLTLDKKLQALAQECGVEVLH